MRNKATKSIKREKGSLLDPQYRDEDAAREWLEKLRWPEGAVCMHCGAMDRVYRITPTKTEPYQDKSGRWRKPRKGLWKCGGCKKQFTVTVGTVFEDSHIPLHKWLLAAHLMCSAKKGISAHQLMRNLDFGNSYKTAWFMAHRIRKAMTGELPEKMNGIVEADETFIGGKAKNKHKHLRGTYAVKPGVRAQDRKAPTSEKLAVFSVLERGGRVHSRHIEKVTGENLKAVLSEVVEADAHLMTDTGSLRGGAHTKHHSLVNHFADEYVRYEEGVCVTTNSIEGYFSLLKRGINGVYHHVGRKHLHRYLSEFDFRYNNRETTDGERAQKALTGIEGKRLMYKGN